MTMAAYTENQQAESRRFVLELLGFTDAEKNLLASTFRLTSRRPFRYAEAGGSERPDVYLANADNADAMQKLRERTPNVHAPAVLIGRSITGWDWPLVHKPIHWMRLFDTLDQQMRVALLERVRRNAGGALGWDGSTRRSCDRRSAPAVSAASATQVQPPLEAVLVVDDSATVRAFMRAKLAPFRFQVDFAESGEVAIDMAQAKAYNCIFLDILMPGMDGFQVCKRIKSSSATRDCAVIMLSSKSSPFDKFRGSWAGCDAYLGKPVGERELLSTIVRFLPSARRVAQAILARPAS
jgi:two-component system cell cycle response regulator